MLQPDAAPAYLRPDVDVFRSLCGLRKLPLVATACAAPMCHCVSPFLLNIEGRRPFLVVCLYFMQKSLFCQCGKGVQILRLVFVLLFSIFPRIGAPLDSRPQALHLIRPVFRSDCRRAPSDFAAATLPVLLAIRFLLVLSIFVFACLFLFVSLGMLSMEHWCFALSLQGLALRFFVFWLLPLSARQNEP